MTQVVTSRGGARIGWFNASWPFANFRSTATSLTLEVWFFGTFSFTPDQVVSIEKYGSIPFLGRGVRINHNVSRYPKKVVFWCLSDPDKFIQKVRETGFMPAPIPVSPSERLQGIPVRWQAVLTVIIIWNALFLLNMGSEGLKAKPGPLSLLAILFLFLTCISIRILRPIQNLFLKEERELDEIEPTLKFITILSGLIFLIASIGMFAT
jgi:hypothetical protein